MSDERLTNHAALGQKLLPFFALLAHIHVFLEALTTQMEEGGEEPRWITTAKRT